jgi:hypothetical protein
MPTKSFLTLDTKWNAVVSSYTAVLSCEAKANVHGHYEDRRWEWARQLKMFWGRLTRRAPLGCLPDVSEKRAASILQADTFGHTHSTAYITAHNRRDVHPAARLHSTWHALAPYSFPVTLEIYDLLGVSGAFSTPLLGGGTISLVTSVRPSVSLSLSMKQQRDSLPTNFHEISHSRFLIQCAGMFRF